jgi:hypothetical protein
MGKPKCMEAHPMRRFVEIEGKRYLWRDIKRLVA